MGNGRQWCGAVKRGLLLAVGFGASLGLLMLLAMDIHAQAARSVPVLSVQEAFSLPCRIAGTPLLAEQIVCYEGPFSEDGTDREVADVAALILRNTGPVELAHAQVLIRQGQRQLLFRATNIPAGAAVLVLENRGAAYVQAAYSSCSGMAVREEAVSLTPQQLRVEAVELATMRVTNLTDRPLENILLYYKTWSGDSGLYLGGITYKTRIAALGAGESVCLQPYHFANGYSKVLKAVLQ